MPDIYRFNDIQMIGFFLVLVRISTFIVSWPILGSESVPVPLKILFSLAVAICLFPILPISMEQQDIQTYRLLWMVLREGFLGLSIGFIGRLFFFILSISGELISTSLGLSNTQLFNPTLNERVSALDQFFVGLGVLIFFTLNGHHYLMEALLESFVLVPISASSLSFQVFNEVGGILHQVCVIGIKLASPVMIALLMTNVAMAVVGRAVPQINVLISSLPVNILVGLLVLFVSLPLMMWQMPQLLEISMQRIFQVLKSF